MADSTLSELSVTFCPLSIDVFTRLIAFSLTSVQFGVGINRVEDEKSQFYLEY